jgi:hypothetical protein
MRSRKYRLSKRSRKKIRKNKNKTRRQRQRGGICYGQGVGSNNYDPNYSIYNTNMLKLFPYSENPSPAYMAK